MAYDNTDRGALFKNEQKQADTHPDYKGSINVNGVDYWISSWLKTSDSGLKYMSLSVTAKEKPNAPPKPAPKQKPQSDYDDDVPF